MLPKEAFIECVMNWSMYLVDYFSKKCRSCEETALSLQKKLIMNPTLLIR